jgi:hypothetical protein
MKRKIISSIALVLCVGLALMIDSDKTAQAQRTRLFVCDSGFITLGDNQIIRLGVDASLDADIVFHEFGHGLTSCSGSTCKYSVTSRAVSTPMRITAGEAIYYDGGDNGTHEVRTRVLSSVQAVRVNMMIIDTVTGNVDSVIHYPQCDGNYNGD